MFTKKLVITSLLAVPYAFAVGCAQDPCLDDGIPNEACITPTGGTNGAVAQTASATAGETDDESGSRGGSRSGSNTDSDSNSSTTNGDTAGTASSTTSNTTPGTSTTNSGSNTMSDTASNTDQTADETDSNDGGNTADETDSNDSNDEGNDSNDETDSNDSNDDGNDSNDDGNDSNDDGNDSNDGGTGDDDDKWCEDKDKDKFGDPEECKYFEDEDDVPEDWVNDWTDCDDEDKNTHVGAAEEEHKDECTKDSDDDGFADDDPDNKDVFPGSDCNDKDANTYPGAAKNEPNSEDKCQKDTDDDDWADSDPPITGVIPGSDCDDDDEDIFPGNAKNEGDKNGCFKDDDDDDWGDNDPDDPDITPGNDCDDDDDKVGECMSDPVVITLDDNVTIKEGESVDLEPEAMGGSGNFNWEWFEYDPDTMTKKTPTTLDDDDVQDVEATPTEPTTHYLVRAEDKDDAENFDEKMITVYLEDVSVDLNTCANMDLSPRWSDRPDIQDPLWTVTEGGTKVCQTRNNHPAAFICPEVVSDVRISGIFNTENSMDDDWIGFVWGMQDDPASSAPRRYYLFSWRREDGTPHFECDNSSDPSHKGMFVRHVDETKPGGRLDDCDLLVGSQAGQNVTLLAEPNDWEGSGGTRGWSADHDYHFEVEYRTTGAKVTIFEAALGGDKTEIASVEVKDSALPEGKVGFFTASQFDVCFREYFFEGLGE